MVESHRAGGLDFERGEPRGRGRRERRAQTARCDGHASPGRPRRECQPWSRTGENPPYGILEGMMETARCGPISNRGVHVRLSCDAPLFYSTGFSRESKPPPSGGGAISLYATKVDATLRFRKGDKLLPGDSKWHPDPAAGNGSNERREICLGFRARTVVHFSTMFFRRRIAL